MTGEPDGEAVRQALSTAELVVASDLTLIECDRVLIRAVSRGRLTEGDAADIRAVLSATSTRWHLLRLMDEVVERARRPFPHEPIRSLDALHLASALVSRSALAVAHLLSLDERVRNNAKALGFTVVPQLKGKQIAS